MNKNIIDEFNNLIFQINYETKYLNNKENTYRLKSISTALSIIKKFNKPLNKEENIIELSKIKNIGNGTIKRIREINKYGHLKEITLTKDNIKYLKNLLKIYGIGPSFAFSLLKLKIYTYQDIIKAVETKKIKINRNIELGLKYYILFFENIPRSTVKKHKNILNVVLDKLNKQLQDNNIINTEDKLIIKVCGSYRRKEKKSNDIDCILTLKTEKQYKKINFLSLFVDELKKVGYVSDEITQNYQKKFMGFVKENNKIFRRLDIRYTDYNNYPAALLYFTGNKYFNIFMRQKAKSNGFKLNEYGLFKNNKKISVSSEKDIFKYLGMVYIKPENRNY